MCEIICSLNSSLFSPVAIRNRPKTLCVDWGRGSNAERDVVEVWTPFVQMTCEFSAGTQSLMPLPLHDGLVNTFFTGGKWAAWSLDAPWPGIQMLPGASIKPGNALQRILLSRRRYSLLWDCRGLHCDSLIDAIQKLQMASPLPQKLWVLLNLLGHNSPWAELLSYSLHSVKCLFLLWAPKPSGLVGY